jgi:sugar O-acyltransferase (sialic acid O-acetyltransferase NeuD family)
MKLLIAGAGGHGRVVADAAIATGLYDEVAFIDDRIGHTEVCEGWQVVGNLQSLAGLHDRYDAFIACFGDAATRQRILEHALTSGWSCPSIVHPRASVSRHAVLGHGTFINAGAVVNTGARIAIGCVVNTSATVDHDCDIAAFVHVCPGAHLAGDVRIGTRTWFGVGAVARQKIVIGRDVTVGAGSVVISDISDAVTIVGNPARVLQR